MWEQFGLLVLLMLCLDAGHQLGCEQQCCMETLGEAAFSGIWFRLWQEILHLGPLSDFLL